jgi:hypothetical protein
VIYLCQNFVGLHFAGGRVSCGGSDFRRRARQLEPYVLVCAMQRLVKITKEVKLSRDPAVTT